MLRKTATYVSILTLVSLTTFADEGMWIPTSIPDSIYQQMKQAGFALTRDDIFNNDSTSLTDAVAQVGKGCSGAFISSDGLLVTNYHCIRYYIQQHSTLQDNLFEKGFMASSSADEKPCNGLTIEIERRITDVTSKVLDGTDSSSPINTRDSIIKRNIARLVAPDSSLPPGWKKRVEPFLFGLQYVLFSYQEFSDVRMVFCPPESLADFGKDKDNWHWPRHNADFAIVRVFADSLNNPSAYNQDNKHYAPLKYFPVDVSDKEENDFSMVMGFPGSTNEYLTKKALQSYRDILLPARLDITEKYLQTVKSQMDSNPRTKLNYTAKYLVASNYFYKWKSDYQTLMDSDFFEVKTHYYNSIPPATSKQLDTIYTKYYELQNKRTFYFESVMNIDMARLVLKFQNIAKAGEKTTEQDIDKYRKTAASLFRTTDLDLNRILFSDMIPGIYSKQPTPGVLAARFGSLDSSKLRTAAVQEYDRSVFSDSSKLLSLLNHNPTRIIDGIKADFLYQLICETADILNEIDGRLLQYRGLIDSLQRRNLGSMARNRSRVYPDANSTLRVSVGKIRGYAPRDAVSYAYQTSVGGILSKHNTGDPNYVLDSCFANFIAGNAKARNVPACFIANCHTTGGNSGSPVINAHGQLIGLNFDRNIEGAASDYIFNEGTSRNIAVDSRYIIFLLKDYYKNSYVLQSLKIMND